MVQQDKVKVRLHTKLKKKEGSKSGRRSRLETGSKTYNTGSERENTDLENMQAFVVIDTDIHIAQVFLTKKDNEAIDYNDQKGIAIL